MNGENMHIEGSSEPIGLTLAVLRLHFVDRRGSKHGPIQSQDVFVLQRSHNGVLDIYYCLSPISYFHYLAHL